MRRCCVVIFAIVVAATFMSGIPLQIAAQEATPDTTGIVKPRPPSPRLARAAARRTSTA